MDTCFENLVHHLHLGIRQLEQLKKSVKVCGVDCDLDGTQDLTPCAQRAGPRSVQGHIERGYQQG